MKNLKELKKYPGNKRGADWILKPVDYRKYSVEDIPNLQPNEVNIIGMIAQNRGRKLRVNLCLVSELPEPQDQTGFIYDLLKDKKVEMAADNTRIRTGVERTISKMIEVYLLERVPQLRDAAGYKQRLMFWRDEIGNIPLDEIQPSEITAAKRKIKRAPATVNRYLSCLSAAFNYAQELNWVTINPMLNGRVRKESERKFERTRWLSDAERELLFEALKTSESPSLEDLVHFSLNTGCRKGEALGLSWSDVDFEANEITFRSVKLETVCNGAELVKGEVKLDLSHQVVEEGLKNGDKAKVLNMTNLGPVRNILLKRKIASSSALVFPKDPRRSWENLVKKIGLEDFTFHDLRHTAASYMVQDGLSLLEVAMHLGHKSTISTARYGHLSSKTTLKTGAAVSSRMYKNGSERTLNVH